MPLELPLPNVDCERVVVQHNGQTCFSGTESRQVPSETWRTLDAALQPGLEAPSSGTWLEGVLHHGLGQGSMHSPGKRRLAGPPPSSCPLCATGGSRARLTEANDDQRSCCVGEAVGVDVELCNPLQLDLHVSRLRLACSWGPAASSAGGTEATRRASIDHCQAGFDSSAGTPTGEGATLQLGFQVCCQRHCARAPPPSRRRPPSAAAPPLRLPPPPPPPTHPPTTPQTKTCKHSLIWGFLAADWAFHPQVHEETVTLQAKERVIVHLRVVPLKPGALHVHGVAWLLNSTAHGQVAFHIRRPLPRTPVSSSK